MCVGIGLQFCVKSWAEVLGGCWIAGVGKWELLVRPMHLWGCSACREVAEASR